MLNYEKGLLGQPETLYKNICGQERGFIMSNRFVLNETSYHGAGAIQNIPEEIKGRGFQKVFLASDPDLIKFGVTKKVTDLLDKAGIAYEIFSEIKPNPTIENVQHGVEAFKKMGADCIVAIGGGSSMDTSKAVGVIITNPEFEDVRSLEGSCTYQEPMCPDYRSSNHSRNRGRGYHQLCNHGC